VTALKLFGQPSQPNHKLVRQSGLGRNAYRRPERGCSAQDFERLIRCEQVNVARRVDYIDAFQKLWGMLDVRKAEGTLVLAELCEAVLAPEWASRLRQGEENSSHR